MPYTGLFEPRDMTLSGLGQRWPVRWLVPVIYAISALAFYFDLQRDNILAYGIIYSPLVATAVFHKGRTGLWILTGVAVGLVVAGACVPVLSSDLADMIGNRLLSVIAIGATAAFVRHARDTQDRLASETRRAEAAERIKTDVLNTLTEEIRPPFHALLGVLTLTMSTSPPAQREVLARVRSDAMQLLGTIDSLIDLSDLSERGLRLDSVNLASIAHTAVADAAIVARERQINITPVIESNPVETSAIGDPAAIRRILDNFLADALRITRPGETISVTVIRRGDTVTASVKDPGHGPPPSLTSGLNEASSAPGGNGLMLSQRLAKAMKGSITAGQQANDGATIALHLPAA